MLKLTQPRVVAVVFVVASVVGCSDALLQTPRSCAVDGDCSGATRVCALGTCVDPTDQRLTTVDVEIDATSAGIPVQSRLGVDLTSNPRVDVALAAGVTLSGIVQHAPDNTGIVAQLLVKPDVDECIAGRILAPTTTSDADGNFSVVVVDGLHYDVAASPSESSLPPYYDDGGINAHAGVNGSQSLPAISISDGAVHITGVVKAGAGAAEIGVEALSVTLSSSDGRRLSSSTRTAADGSFDLFLAEPAAALTLTVAPTVDNTGYPTVLVENVDASIEAACDPPETASSCIDVGTISLGDVLAPTRLDVTVRGSDGAPVADAVAVMQATIGAGIFTASASSGPDGIFTAQLPPGHYTIAVFGPPDSRTAGLLPPLKLDIPSLTGTFDMNLPSRVRLQGTVRDSDKAPLAGAELTIVRVGDVNKNPEPILGDSIVSFSATSAEDGTFDVGVDPGTYRIGTRPAPGSNAPDFSSLVVVPQAGLDADIELPPRAFVAGTVVFAGQPIGSAYVRVFSSLRDENNAAILIGEAAAGADGSFSIVVPDFVSGVTNPNPP